MFKSVMCYLHTTDLLFTQYRFVTHTLQICYSLTTDLLFTHNIFVIHTLQICYSHTTDLLITHYIFVIYIPQILTLINQILDWPKECADASLR